MSTNPLPPSTEVCIVGAGPSGLACALGLAARQVPFVIVDALSEGHNGSRAIVVYPGTLEALSVLNPQVSADIVEAGVRGETLRAFDRHGQPVFRIPLSKLKTKYPFGMYLAQHIVEERMRAGLQRSGSDIHFNKRVSAIKEVTGGAQYELSFESGEVLTARYVVAADGAKSMLRSFAGITLRDPYTKKEAAPGPQDSNFVVADVLFATPTDNVSRDGLQLNIGDDGFVLTGPMKDETLPPDDPGQNLFRLYIGMSGIPPRAPDLAYLQGILDARGPGSSTSPPTVPKIVKLLHSTRYRTRPALADRYVQGTKGGAYILLVGDAAHTHGPAGGQGMNLGICDGCALALAIDAHRTAGLAAAAGRGETKRDADAAAHILEVYSKTRREVGREVVDMVQFMTKLEAGGLSWAEYLRVTALRLLSQIPFVNSKLAMDISGLGRATRK